MISLNTAGEALTSRLQPRAARTIDHRFRAFASTTSILLFLPRNFRARSGSRSPHHTVCPCRASSCASNEPAPPTPSTKMRIGSQPYHNCRAASPQRAGTFRSSTSSPVAAKRQTARLVQPHRADPIVPALIVGALHLPGPQVRDALPRCRREDAEVRIIVNRDVHPICPFAIHCSGLSKSVESNSIAPILGGYGREIL